ncbi:MAG: AhpC/TSA family protein [Flavobacterium sp.]|nr:AhpC/TSA family protein [Flavobacterium sp.]
MNKLLLVLVFCTLTGFGQKKTISGFITGFNNSDLVRLYDYETEKYIDSTLFSDNVFIFKNFINTEIPRQLRINIVSDHPFSTNLLIANEKVIVTGDRKDFPYDIKISGSKFQDESNVLNDKLKKLQKERDEIVVFWRTDVADKNEIYKEKLSKLNKRAEEIDFKRDSIKMNYIDKNPNTFIALEELNNLKEKYSKINLQQNYNRLKDEFKSHYYGKAIETYLSVGQIIEEGDLLYDFEALNQYNKKHNLSDYKGKYIFLDFTKEYCAPCETAIKELKILNEEYNNKIQIISFTSEKSKDYWKKGILRNTINWLCLWDGKGTESKTIMKYGVTGYPTFFIINPEGKIIKKIVGHEKGILEQEFKKLFD